MKTYKEEITIGQLGVNFLLDGDDTNNQMVVFECVFPPGAKVPVPHYHVEVDEMVYGLAGTGSSYVGDKRIDIRPGDHCFIPRGVLHHHDNHTSETVKMLCVLTPASIGPAYFREMSELLKGGGPPDRIKAAEIMARHGLVAAV
ncbi:MAG: cupin domain-containing protein [Bacteroidota bacterium]|nr:cupin domain-containing protein [Bacteroidota bacterium]